MSTLNHGRGPTIHLSFSLEMRNLQLSHFKRGVFQQHRSFVQRFQWVPKPQHFELQKGIAVV